MSDDSQALFGYQRTTASDKTARVRAVFDSVASRYDLMNDLMSGGLHRLWKRYAIELLQLRDGQRVLDLAAGTCDLTRLIVASRWRDVEVMCSDINESMLRRGRDRLINDGVTAAVDYALADAERLPFADASFDRLIIGFGLRNVSHKGRALEEMRRVLAPGGRALVLEFSQPKSALLANLYDQYSFRVLPRLGQLIANDADSYRYLAESIRVHPDQDTLALMMRRAGFDEVNYHDLLNGIVAIHVGETY